jgi:16S rRNA (cytosine967-C5)-methyltransferase
VAVHVLLAVVKEGKSLTQALENELPTVPLSERSFVQALCFGVCRDFYRLEALLQQLLAKPFRNKDLDIKLLLMSGLFQLQSMRVKPHAAVAETVAAVGRKRWAKAVVNAVLRQFQREQTDLLQQVDQSWQTRYSHPDWMIARFKQDWPEQAEAILQANNQPGPMVLRVNRQRISREDYLKQLADQKIAAQPLNEVDTAIILAQAVAVDRLPGFEKGWVSVQDGAAQMAACLLDVQPGQTVLDMCAAPGGKTAAILERQADVQLLALDISSSRLKKVEENLLRLGLIAECQQTDVSQAGEWCERQYDRILLDAPCSALGVIRRHPDIKLLRRDSDIEALAEMQQAMLKLAWQALKPGGVLLYATCSVLKQENDLQLQQFMAQQPEVVVWPIDATWGLPQSVGRQLLPGQQQMDGFYYARLVKQA